MPTPSTPPSSLLNGKTGLPKTLQCDARPAASLKETLQRGDESLRDQFECGVPVETLVVERARLVDAILGQAFHLHLASHADHLALVAVGGYGRGELHPHSDIDVLVLVDSMEQQGSLAQVEAFISLLWDIGLHVGHSVRTVEDCVREAASDITVATSLMESRLLAGDATLHARMSRATAPDRVWSSGEFFAAKQREQQERHAKFHDTAYKLEPNVKESPGGLRDIQTIGWVAKRHFGVTSLQELVRLGFLTEQEYLSLNAGQNHLWKIRFALHLLHGRREDRLLFDSQVKLARLFGFQDAPSNLAVEQFMQQYYRTVMELSRLNEMLLQLFDEAILNPSRAEAMPLNTDFADRGGLLTVHDPGLFAKKPSALLEMFLVLERHPRLKGVSTDTIRLVRDNLSRIDEPYRTDPVNRSLFLSILREPQGVTHELRRMNRYGVLGRYLPAFGAVVGRMQYDLFHTYTVDEHTLFVVSNLRRFALPRYDHEFPLCSRVMQQLPKPELAYLAGLFHDIAKGRGGDHSQLGAIEAEKFCLDHDLPRYDARLVGWLVQNHLLLSLTAQKKDINDPDVVNAFAAQVGDQTHLDYLYVLTVADVRATNPDLWNSWKAGLFEELYHNASRALRLGVENPIDKEELVQQRQEAARQILMERGLSGDAVAPVWRSLSDEYFLAHSADEIAWQTAHLTGRLDGGTSLVFLRQQPQRGATAIGIYSRQDDFVFGRVTAVLAQLGLTILGARIVAMDRSASLDTYEVLEDNGMPIEDPARLEEIETTLVRELNRRNASPIPVTRRAPRQVRMFTTNTRIDFSDDARGRFSVLEITAGDRPGLLSLIGQVLKASGIRLLNAKITTVGERAEDVFFITDSSGKPLHDPATREQLRLALLERIGEAG